MLKRILTIAGLVGISCAAIAYESHAQTSRVYLAGYLGLNTFNDQKFTETSSARSGDLEIDNATRFAGALGIRLSRNLRVEGEISYRNGEINTMDISGVGTFAGGGELKSTMGMLNLYYDFDVPWRVQPYIGAGVGFAWHNGEITDSSGLLSSSSTDDSGLVWNVGGGLKYRPRTDLAFTGSYRYLDAADLELGAYEVDYGSHEFRLGIEWDLPVR